MIIDESAKVFNAQIVEKKYTEKVITIHYVQKLKQSESPPEICNSEGMHSGARIETAAAAAATEDVKEKDFADPLLEKILPEQICTGYQSEK